MTLLTSHLLAALSLGLIGLIALAAATGHLTPVTHLMRRAALRLFASIADMNRIDRSLR